MPHQLLKIWALPPQVNWMLEFNRSWIRYSQGVDPTFSDNFILADVILSPEYPRRFSNYSGDISGRYIGAVAMLPDDIQAARLPGLIEQIIKHQKPDGRFGTADLSYASEDIGPENMALLWGNGRLLVGLMEYYAYSNSAETLDAARKLGDFLLNVNEACADPAVRERVTGQGPSGFICFTQLIEGLDMLWLATKDDRYMDAAKSIVPLLEGRGKQHSHGYLTTLRSYVMLYESTVDKTFLEAAETPFNELVATADYKVNGGVLEYFGYKNGRDEGCSEADFLRLALQLWKATDDMTYLDFAERSLLNSFNAGQFKYGEFGHRRFDATGYIAAIDVGRSWWCCTMHGHRAFQDVIEAVVTHEDNLVKVNLFQEGTWTSPALSIKLSRPAAQNAARTSFKIIVTQASAEQQTIAIRKPSWIEEATIRLNGREIPVEVVNGYFATTREWEAGDTIAIDCSYKMKLLTRDGKTLSPEQLTATPVNAALYYGPWLLGVDEDLDPFFHGEPWRSNTIQLSSAIKGSEAYEAPEHPMIIQDAHLNVAYTHGGFPDPCRVTLRPITEQTLHHQSMVSYWLNYVK